MKGLTPKQKKKSNKPGVSADKEREQKFGKLRPPKEIEAILDQLDTLAYELDEFESQIYDIRILVENGAKYLREDLP